MGGEVLGRYGTMVNPDNPANSSGDPNFVTTANFNFGYTKVSGAYPASQPGTHTVAAGDTLAGVAKSVYGDSSLWYLIADANGLGGDRDLRAGQTLTVPSRVAGAKNNSTTFKPYNPGAVVGDTTPNPPNPPPQSSGGGGGGCGGLGAIIVIVVAVVVAYFTEDWVSTSQWASSMLGSATPYVAAAIGGAAGSLAGQAAGNVLGIQKGFDWNAVALAALSAGVTKGVRGTGVGGTGFTGAVTQAAISNAMTQGIAVVTGLQKDFSWTNVAAAAVGAGVGQVAGDAGGSADANASSGWSDNAGKIARAGLTGFAAGMASNAMRGGRQTVIQVATDAFGNALGSSMGESLKDTGTQEDKLGEFIQKNQTSWDTRAGAYDQLVGAFASSRSMGGGDGVQYAANGVEDPLMPKVVSDAGPAAAEPALSFADDVAARKAANNPMGLPIGGGRSTPRTYTVQSGDNPATIGRMFYDDERAGATILADNGLDASIKGARSLQPGTVLTLRDDIGV